MNEERLIKLLTSAPNQKALFRFILALVPSVNDADDLLQETNVEIWRQAKQFEDGTNFLAWARTIANHKVQHYRRQRQRDRLVFDDELIGQLAAQAAHLAADEPERILAIRQCMAELEPGQRRLIQQRYSSREKLKDLAAKEGQPAGSLAVTLHRIRRILMSCVDGKLDSIPKERDSKK